MFAPTPHRALGGALFDASSSAAHLGDLGGLTLSPPVRFAGGALDRDGGGADLLVSPAASAVATGTAVAALPSLDSPALATAPTLTAPADPLAWRKILWDAQPFEDNHTPDSFLSSAVLNANVQMHTFTSMMVETMPITQQISCSAVFFFVFHQLVRHRLSPSTLMLGNVSAFLVGYLVACLVRWRAPHALFDAADSAEGSAGAVVAYVASMRADEQKRRAAADSAAAASAMATATATASVVAPGGGAGGNSSSSNSNTSAAASTGSIGLASTSAAGTASAASAVPPSSSSSSAFASESFVAAPSRPRVAAVAVAVMPPVGGDNGWAQLMRLCPQPALLARVGAPALAFYRVCERVAIFCAVLHMLSPVLRTLTLSFSEDTIAALSLLCSTLHIVLFDYDVMCATHPKFSGTVSLNAAIFSSVLLASRLPAALHVFAFVCFAFEIFAGLPIVLALVRRASSPLHFAATAALCVLAARALAALSTTLLYSFVVAVAFVTFLCPAWLVYVQRYKNEIRGPWDYDDTKELDEL